MGILLLTRYKLYELVGHAKGQNFAFRFTTYIKCINAGGGGGVGGGGGRGGRNTKENLQIIN